MAFRFESLDIWRLAIEYAEDCYNIARCFPREELFSLGDQLRRAAISISNNIAEGSGSSTNKNFCSFLDISIKSALETVNIIYFSERQHYIDETQKKRLYVKAEDLVKKIRAFKNSLSLS